MSTTIYTISVNPDLIPDQDLAPLLEALQDFEPVLDEFAEQLTAGEKAGFASQGAAYGSAWAALAPSTVRDRFRQGYGPNAPLVRTGNLADSIGESVNLTPDSVQVGVDAGEVPYANYLQSGTSRMPARLLVAVSDDMIDDMMQTLRAYLAAATGGGLDGITITTETT